MSGDKGEGGAASLKGLRLLTMDRGPEGYGFHMFTNKSLKVLCVSLKKNSIDSSTPL
jgi:hypothetical protein